MRWLPLVLSALLTPAFLPAAELEYTHLGKVEFIENDTVILGVAPKIGRIVSFKRKGGEEWIAVEDKPAGKFWLPWGGDRVWPTAQFILPQIYGNEMFDPVIDGQPWEVVAKEKSKIEIRSGFSPQLGIRMSRTIELLPDGVSHEWLVVKERPSSIPIHFWVVTGIQAPKLALMESNPKVPHPGRKPFRFWQEHTPDPKGAKLVENTRVLTVAGEQKCKIGTYGGWIAAVKGNEAFLQAIAYDPSGVYLDASNLQFFSDPKIAVYELETQSPMWMLSPGESKTWKVLWKLLTLSDPWTDAEAARLLEIEITK